MSFLLNYFKKSKDEGDNEEEGEYSIENDKNLKDFELFYSGIKKKNDHIKAMQKFNEELPEETKELEGKSIEKGIDKKLGGEDIEKIIKFSKENKLDDKDLKLLLHLCHINLKKHTQNNKKKIIRRKVLHNQNINSLRKRKKNLDLSSLRYLEDHKKINTNMEQSEKLSSPEKSINKNYLYSDFKSSNGDKDSDYIKMYINKDGEEADKDEYVTDEHDSKEIKGDPKHLKSFLQRQDLNITDLRDLSELRNNKGSWTNFLFDRIDDKEEEIKKNKKKEKEKLYDNIIIHNDVVFNSGEEREREEEEEQDSEGINNSKNYTLSLNKNKIINKKYKLKNINLLKKAFDSNQDNSKYFNAPNYFLEKNNQETDNAKLNQWFHEKKKRRRNSYELERLLQDRRRKLSTDYDPYIYEEDYDSVSTTDSSCHIIKYPRYTYEMNGKNYFLKKNEFQLEEEDKFLRKGHPQVEGDEFDFETYKDFSNNLLKKKHHLNYFKKSLEDLDKKSRSVSIILEESEAEKSVKDDKTLKKNKDLIYMPYNERTDFKKCELKKNLCIQTNNLDKSNENILPIDSSYNPILSENLKRSIKDENILSSNKSKKERSKSWFTQFNFLKRKKKKNLKNNKHDLSSLSLDTFERIEEEKKKISHEEKIDDEQHKLYKSWVEIRSHYPEYNLSSNYKIHSEDFYLKEKEKEKVEEKEREMEEEKEKEKENEKEKEIKIKKEPNKTNIELNEAKKLKKKERKKNQLRLSELFSENGSQNWFSRLFSTELKKNEEDDVEELKEHDEEQKHEKVETIEMKGKIKEKPVRYSSFDHIDSEGNKLLLPQERDILTKERKEIYLKLSEYFANLSLKQEDAIKKIKIKKTNHSPIDKQSLNLQKNNHTSPRCPLSLKFSKSEEIEEIRSHCILFSPTKNSKLRASFSQPLPTGMKPIDFNDAERVRKKLSEECGGKLPLDSPEYVVLEAAELNLEIGRIKKND